MPDGENATARRPARDHGLDLLKGLGCVCMVVAHSGTFDTVDRFAPYLLFAIGPATILFFGTAGITSRFQTSRYSLGALLAYYAFLFVLGYTYNGLVAADFYRVPTLEIFQIIALGVTTVSLIDRSGAGRPFTYAAVAALLLGTRWLCMWLAPGFHGGGLLLPYATYIPSHTVAENPASAWPGFPLLCWLWVFPAACAMYEISARANLIVAALAAGALVGLEAAGFDTGWHDKWGMPPGYACLELVYLGVSLAAVKRLRGWQPGARNVLIYFGRNSLTFLFVHNAGLLAAYLMRWASLYVAWTAGVVATYVAMRAFDRLPRWRGFSSLGPWFVLIALCLALPFLARRSEAWSNAVWFGELALGLVFAKHFDLLADRIKRRRAPAASGQQERAGALAAR